MILWGGDFQGLLRRGEGSLGHTYLSSQPSRLWWGTLPQLVTLAGILVMQLAGQAGHEGSELHCLQGCPDGFIRVLMQHVEVHPQRAREQDGVLPGGVAGQNQA